MIDRYTVIRLGISFGRSIPRGPLGIADNANKTSDGTRWYERPDYSDIEAQQVCDWLNGCDQPLPDVRL